MSSLGLCVTLGLLKDFRLQALIGSMEGLGAKKLKNRHTGFLCTA